MTGKPRPIITGYRAPSFSALLSLDPNPPHAAPLRYSAEPSWPGWRQRVEEPPSDITPLSQHLGVAGVSALLARRARSDHYYL